METLGQILLWAALATSGAALLVVLVGFVVDPYQRFRKSRWYRTYYSRPRRLNPGLALSHDYDSAVIGTSMIQTLKPSVMDRITGSRSLKLVVLTASAREIRLTLEVALRAGRARTVILCFSPTTCTGEPDRLTFGERGFPLYFYLSGPAATARYLLAFDTLRQCLKVIRRNLRMDRPKSFDPELFGYPHTEPVCSRDRVLAAWPERDRLRPQDPEDLRFGGLRRSFDENYLPVLARARGVRFLVYFAPVSVLAWMHDRERGVLEDLCRFKDYVIERLLELPEVELYDFQLREEIVTDLDNYYDLVHHSPAVSELLFEDLWRGVGRITKADPGAFLEGIEALIARSPSP